MGNERRTITVADDEAIIKLIGYAQERLVFMAPAVSIEVAKALAAAWAKLGTDKVSIILDLDPEVYRLGYGEMEGLELLQKTAQGLGTLLHRQPGIRIGLLLSDEVTMVYSPTPQLIEAGPASPEAPNAVVLNSALPEVARELGQGENGVRDQTVGLDPVKPEALEHTRRDLSDNPPQRFDVARTLRVFDTFFQFVELKLRGVAIERKTVRIPNDLMGLAKDEETRRRITASFKLVGGDEKLSGADLAQARTQIANRYLKSIKDYGQVIRRCDRADFDRAVEKLKEKVAAFRDKVTRELQDRMDRNRAELAKYLLPTVAANPPERWKQSVFFEKDAPHKMLEDDLEKAFGKAGALVGKMEVNCVYKGVTHESLRDDEFVDAARKALPGLDKLFEEYTAAASPKDL